MDENSTNLPLKPTRIIRNLPRKRRQQQRTESSPSSNRNHNQDNENENDNVITTSASEAIQHDEPGAISIRGMGRNGTGSFTEEGTIVYSMGGGGGGEGEGILSNNDDRLAIESNENNETTIVAQLAPEAEDVEALQDNVNALKQQLQKERLEHQQQHAILVNAVVATTAQDNETTTTRSGNKTTCKRLLLLSSLFFVVAIATGVTVYMLIDPEDEKRDKISEEVDLNVGQNRSSEHDQTPSPLTNFPTLTLTTSNATSEPTIGEVDCDLLNFTINCSTPFFPHSCDIIVPVVGACDQEAYELSFQYHGGDCQRSSNVQFGFSCTDFQGGPSEENGSSSYIVAINHETDQLYFSGFVQVGNIFTLVIWLTANELYTNNMDLYIYNPKGQQFVIDIVQPENLQQHIKFEGSCSDEALFLGDYYGSLRLVQLVGRNGFISFLNFVSFWVKIENNQAGPAVVRLISMFATFNVMGDDDDDQAITFDLTNEVDGWILGPGEVLELETSEMTLDATFRQTYQFNVTVGGETLEGGHTCSMSETYQFTSGGIS